MFKLLVFEMVVELFEKSVNVHTVYCTSLFESLASGGRATETVHADFKEIGSSSNVDIKNVTDDGVLCYLCHSEIILSHFIYSLYNHGVLFSSRFFIFILFNFRVEKRKCIIERSHPVYETYVHRFFSVYDRSDIGCKLSDLQHILSEFFCRNI